MTAEDEDEGTVPGPSIETSVVLKFMLATAFMVATPTALFFASMYGLLDGIFANTIGIPSDSSRGAISGGLAVVGVNLVVAAFVVLAFRETDVVKDKRSGVKSD